MPKTEHRFAHHTSVVVEAAHPRTTATTWPEGDELVRPYVMLTSHATWASVNVVVYGTAAELLALFGPVVDDLRQHLATDVAL